jgi:hypothetical protein
MHLAIEQRLRTDGHCRRVAIVVTESPVADSRAVSPAVDLLERKNAELEVRLILP